MERDSAKNATLSCDTTSTLNGDQCMIQIKMQSHVQTSRKRGLQVVHDSSDDHHRTAMQHGDTDIPTSAQKNRRASRDDLSIMLRSSPGKNEPFLPFGSSRTIIHTVLFLTLLFDFLCHNSMRNCCAVAATKDFSPYNMNNGFHTNQRADARQLQQCVAAPIPWEPNETTGHKSTYKVGVLAIRGFDNAYKEFNHTFSDYLTATVGPRFDPPIQFLMEPLNFTTLFSYTESKEIDLIYVNPSAYSCIESEYGAQSLVSQISKRAIGGEIYHLAKFGGVIITRDNADDINTIEDIKGKITACASISGLGSGQMQFRALIEAGLSYVDSPKQLVFTSNQGKVVNGVLYGDFDVGFVRTDQLERTTDKITKTLVNTSKFKIINPQMGLEIAGVPFPFVSSTRLYPEWNLAGLSHVPNEVLREVQQAMYELADYAAVGKDAENCYEASTCTGMEMGSQSRIDCEDLCNAESLTRAPCDTTTDVALLAHKAKLSGRYTGWTTTDSYMELRNMQEETSFISKDPTTGVMQCIRSSKLYDAVVCPVGYFKKTEDEVENGCMAAGLPCKELDTKYQCLCKPCVKGFDVDVSPMLPQTTEMSKTLTQNDMLPCQKMSVCSTIQQTQIVNFQAVDNLQRTNTTMSVLVREGQVKWTVPAKLMVNSTNKYEFAVEPNRVGSILLEVFIEGLHISESPLVLEVIPRDCATEMGDKLLEPDEEGNCVCRANSVDIKGRKTRCVPYSTLLPSILVPFLVLSCLLVYFYIEHKKKQADSVWAVKPSELHFTDPPETIGRGTFGLVVLAEYRGTMVAIKRVIPPKVSTKERKVARRLSLLGTGEKSSSSSGYSHIINIEHNKDSVVDSGKEIKGEPSSHSTAETRSTTTQGRQGKRRRRSSTLSDVNFDFPDEEHGMLASTSNFQLEGKPRSNSLSKIGKPTGTRRLSWSDTPEDASKNGKSNRRRRLSWSDLTEDSKETSSKISSRRNSWLDKPVTTDDCAWTNSSKGFSLVPRKRRSFGDKTADDTKNGSANTTRTESESDPEGNVERVLDSGKKSSFRGIVSRRSTSSKDSKGSSERRSRWRIRYHSEYALLCSDFIVEMRHLSKLRHPCITTVMGAVISKKEEPMLVMEYMEHGSLYDLLHNDTMVIEGEIVLPILRDIAQGMRFLHAANPQVIHGDLKAANILVDRKFRAKVADFGLSQKKRVGATGTPLWMAPELLRNESENTTASDVYSFGIILYEVYSRKDPYDGEDIGKILYEVADRNVNKRPAVPENTPPTIVTIMHDTVMGDVDSRPTFEELDLRLKRLDIANVEPTIQTRKEDHQAKRNSALLYDIFPKHVADGLSQGRKVEPDKRDCVTIFMSDIVGFTKISSNLSSSKVFDMLDRLYTQFDALARLYDLFKVETIGDAYLAATNLVKDQPDHARIIAEFAIDAMEAAQDTLIDEHNPSLGYLNIRVGFHSGPIVAHVVGTHHPKYTLFGDTINTASRMESTSEVGRIQCSEQSAAHLHKQFPELDILPRGKINVKGKGEMETFWVNERSDPSVKKTDSTKTSHLSRGTTMPVANTPDTNGMSVEKEPTERKDGNHIMSKKRSSIASANSATALAAVAELDEMSQHDTYEDEED